MLNYNRVVFASVRRCILTQYRMYRRPKNNGYAIPNPRVANPGLQHQVRMKRKTGVEGEPVSDFNEYEADFSELHNVHRQHESEIETNKERIKYFIVRQKYFKPEGKQNFLTWAEKEQIRNLHKTDPEQWSIQRLVESFPATDEIILKVLQNTWTPKNMKRIQGHDKSVQQTWKAFEAGELIHLDTDFVEHLKKFSHRRFDSANNAYTNVANDQVQFQFPEPKSKEFSHIINSLPKHKRTVAEIEAPKSAEKTILQNSEPARESIPPPTEGDTYVFGQIVGRKYKTFDQFERNKKKSNESATNLSKMAQIRSAQETTRDNKKAKTPIVDELATNIENVISDKLAKVELENTLRSHKPSHSPLASIEPPPLSDIERYDAVKNPSGTGIVVDLSERNQFDVHVQRYNTRTVTITPTDEADKLQTRSIRERIYIPRKAYKRGALYKVNDCFYADDGELLYRVPGLV